MRKDKPQDNKVLKQKVILVEGEDELYFFIWALQVLDVCKDEIQVLTFGGVNNLTNFLKILKNDDNYSKITDILILRDAESNLQDAIRSVQSSLNEIGFRHSGRIFRLEDLNNKRVGIGFFTKQSDIERNSGTLEDLLICMTANSDALTAAQRSFEAFVANGGTSTHPHKTLLHLYLTLDSSTVGLKIGEATKAGAWDFQSSSFEPFLTLIRDICA